MKWFGSICLVIIVLSSVRVVAQSKTEYLDLYRRVAVFPLNVPVEMKSEGEEAWWQMREALTEHRRFLVASKNFLEKKGVFQGREELEPADGIILGKLLDAHLLITTFLHKNQLKMIAYETKLGRVVWSSKVWLQSSVLKKDQIVSVTNSLVKDFVHKLPYQGFVVLDEILKRVLFERDGRTLFKAFVGTGFDIEEGDSVQMIRMVNPVYQPLLDNATVEIFAEGRVHSVKHDHVIVELLRATSLEDLSENSLVRLPKELAKVRQQVVSQGPLKNLEPGFYSADRKNMTEQEKERKPLIAALTFVANIIGMLLLAF